MGSAFKQTAVHWWKYPTLNALMHFRVEISVNQMEKYKKMRKYKREHLLHIDKEKSTERTWNMDNDQQ